MPTRARIAASDIAEAILEVTGDALMSGDFDALAAVYHVPQVIVTMAGPINMETPDDLRRAFDGTHQYFKGLGITEVIRACVAAEYTSPTRIESTHVTELVKNGERLNDPYPVFSVLEKKGGNWKVTRGEYALEATNGHALALGLADASHRKQST
jgi:ketosteroid isomerase-like protein